ncbi:MAG: alanine racemase [Halioglobus sp.]
MARPAQALLNLDALRHNVRHARTLASGARLMAVVKANAYGHGAVTIAKELQPVVDALAVASVDEAIELHDSGIRAPILLLEGPFEAAELQQAAQRDFWVTVASEQQLAWLEQAKLTNPLQCWLKVNTGMNRLGVDSAHAPAFFQRLVSCANCATAPVLYTHFSSADNLLSARTERQLERFAALPIDAPRSAANSAAVLAWPGAHLDWVRPGYMLYGNSPLPDAHPNTKALRPVMTLTSRVIALREVEAGAAVGYGGTFVSQRSSRIATIAIGYGDGYPRQAVNGTPLLINGQRARLAGRVSMDMLTADVTDLEGVQAGSEVVLWGDGLSVDEISRYAGNTIGYELTTRMPSRTPRVVSVS